ncbi:putative UvsX-like protein [Salmonella phage vB_SenS-EnJE6]|uniref:Putative UvsX-like protein n=1 Tax=Salmonella phage vB_SenS-EnJE6 TaxID=2603849 RepID=A0A650EQR1_9CAUD|nr:putative UvsX-like protein [Salmonella phage vB_SenS-EnJE6]QGT52287.1 putative UvsX-like protein [Salmonella phage vB_SenS-EnJE6]
MTDFQKRVFRAVAAHTFKKGSCSVLDLRRTYFQYYSSSLIENTLKVLVKDGAVKSKAGKYSAVAEVKGYQATPEDLE